MVGVLRLLRLAKALVRDVEGGLERDEKAL